jgi:hypothetical protein
MAQAGRGGGGAKGGQGGAGREGSGAGSTGGRDSAMGGGRGGSSGGGPDLSQKGTGFGGFLDSLMGYENIGQRVAAYNNNPQRPGGKWNQPVAMVPNFPNATLGYTVASMLGMPMSPMGIVGALPDIAYGIANNTAPQSIPQRVAEAFGASPGRQEGFTGVGRERDGRGGALRANENGLLAGAPIEAQQVLPQPETPATEFKKGRYALGMNGIPAPLGYQYQKAWWL